MGRMGKCAVALTAALAIALSSVNVCVLWHLWRHPPRLLLEAVPEGFRWQGAHCAALLKVRDGRPDWLMVWRREEEQH